MKVELEKYFIDDISHAREIYIADPDKTNLELYNELNYTRDIMAKISRMLNNEKVKTAKLETTIKVNIFNNIGLRRKIEIYKKRGCA